MDASIWMQANILKDVNLSFPPQVGERPASPILELRYYSFAELSNRTDDENLQLNIVLFQGSLFNGLSIFDVRQIGRRIYYHIENWKEELKQNE